MYAGDAADWCGSCRGVGVEGDVRQTEANEQRHSLTGVWIDDMKQARQGPPVPCACKLNTPSIPAILGAVRQIRWHNACEVCAVAVAIWTISDSNPPSPSAVNVMTQQAAWGPPTHFPVQTLLAQLARHPLSTFPLYLGYLSHICRAPLSLFSFSSLLPQKLHRHDNTLLF